MNYFDRVSSQQPNFTYIGIGSAPHVTTLEEYTAKQNQLLPFFVREMYETHENSPGWTLRVLHFDPYFSQKLPFLQAYFEQEGLVFHQHQGAYYWIGDSIEVVLIPEKIERGRNDKCIEDMVNECVKTQTQLVVQSFTGEETYSWFRSLFHKTTNRYSFKENILFDVSYGSDVGCSTDMSVYRPIMGYQGKFINLLLYTNPEVLNALELYPENTKIAERARRIYYAEFRNIMNTKHVDYRRMVQGLDGVIGNYSSAEEIMEEIRTDLDILAPILMKLGLLQSKDNLELQVLLNNYKQYDMYKWYTMVVNLVKLEEPVATVLANPQ
jgi:hypothetical protein